MFYYIDQSLIPALLIGLVKTKSDVIVRSVETDLGRLTLVVAVISVDAYLFGGFYDLPCTVLPDSKENEFGSSDQEACPSAGKNTGVVLVPHSIWKCPHSYFQWCRYF